MKSVYQVAWVQCAEVGCISGLAVDIRHVRNFEDRWTCDEHDPDRKADR